MKELLFLLVLFVSNVIQAITGFAGTVLAMPPSVYLLGLDHAKVILNAMAWLSGLMIAVTGYRHINWKELFNALGTALGLVALPASYFAYLIPCILLYMMLATSLKKAYVRHYGELL